MKLLPLLPCLLLALAAPLRAQDSAEPKAPEKRAEAKAKAKGKADRKPKGEARPQADRDQGLAELEAKLAEAPDKADNWIALAKAYEARALSLLEEAKAKFDDGSAAEALAESYLRAGRGQEALALLEEAGRSNSKDPRYWLRLGRISARLGPAVDQDSRNRLFDRAVQYAGDDVEVLVEASDYYLASSQVDQATAVCRQALEANPKAVGPRLRLSLIHEREGDLREAMALLEEALLLERRNPEVRRMLAGLLLRQERLAEAIPHLREVLEMGEGSERDYSGLSRLMVEAGQLEEAVSLLREGAERHPDSPEFPLLLTFALGRLDRWEEALDQFERTRALARANRPEIIDTAFHFRYGAALERVGRIDDAVAELRRALEDLEEVEAGDEEAEFAATVLNYLAYIWIERGENLDEAGPMALRAYELSPESGAIADTVGWLHFQKGDYARALSELKKAERLVEEPDAVILDHLGQTLAKLNEKELAADYFRRSLALEPGKEEVKARLEALKD
jgi:tetratricopeptide (TPR) repeat protein